jgi:hypothetical protein
MKITAKQTTKKVSTLKLPDGQYIQTGKGTLKELFRIHFPDSKLIDDSDDGQGQQKPGHMRTYNEERRLEPGQMCDQSIKNLMGAMYFQTI